VISIVLTLNALPACTKPPSWQTLLAGRISQQYPGYVIEKPDPGSLLIVRPGLPAIPVDVEAIAGFCRRGPKDCNYAIDQMLTGLQPQP
jgi:hypothetical protein